MVKTLVCLAMLVATLTTTPVMAQDDMTPFQRWAQKQIKQDDDEIRFMRQQAMQQDQLDTLEEINNNLKNRNYDSGY